MRAQVAACSQTMTCGQRGCRARRPSDRPVLRGDRPSSWSRDSRFPAPLPNASATGREVRLPWTWRAAGRWLVVRLWCGTELRSWAPTGPATSSLPTRSACSVGSLAGARGGTANRGETGETGTPRLDGRRGPASMASRAIPVRARSSLAVRQGPSAGCPRRTSSPGSAGERLAAFGRPGYPRRHEPSTQEGGGSAPDRHRAGGARALSSPAGSWRATSTGGWGCKGVVTDATTRCARRRARVCAFDRRTRASLERYRSRGDCAVLRRTSAPTSYGAGQCVCASTCRGGTGRGLGDRLAPNAIA
jgi:hypothetical protein